MKKYKIANVHWEDASHYRDMGSIEWFATKGSRLTVSTVGFVLRFDKRDIVLAQEINDDDNARDVTVVLRSIITKVEYLKS